MKTNRLEQGMYKGTPRAVLPRAPKSCDNISDSLTLTSVNENYSSRLSIPKNYISYANCHFSMVFNIY